MSNEGLEEKELDATGADPSAESDAPGATAAPAAVEADEDDGFMSPAEAKLAEANDRYVRLMADFDNFRKRAAKERVELLQGAGEDLLRDVLPVVDNLERALAAGAAAGTDGADAVVKGVELTLRQFQSVLTRHGVERIQAKGQPFDPHQHEAIAQIEREDVAEDTVVEELEPGYLIRGRILRPVKVRVAKPKTAEKRMPADLHCPVCDPEKNQASRLAIIVEYPAGMGGEYGCIGTCRKSFETESTTGGLVLWEKDRDGSGNRISGPYPAANLR